MKDRIGRAAIILALALLAACTMERDQKISGDTPIDVAQSIYNLAMDLPPDKRQEFSTAIASLQLVVTDRQLQTEQTTVTPQLVQIVRGRTPFEVIQLAAVYRNSFPRFSPAEMRRSSKRSRKTPGAVRPEEMPQTVPSADDS